MLLLGRDPCEAGLPRDRPATCRYSLFQESMENCSLTHQGCEYPVTWETEVAANQVWVCGFRVDWGKAAWVSLLDQKWTTCKGKL